MKPSLWRVAATLAFCGIGSTAYSGTVGFIYSDGSYTTLSVAGAFNTEAFGINNAGQIVGDYQNGVFRQGFLYSGGSFTTLNVPGKQQTMPFDINNAGQVVGYSNNNNGDVTQGFIYSGGIYTNLTVPGAVKTWAFGINDAGQVVGAYFDGTNNHGYLYTGGIYTTFDVPGAASTAASDINNAGQVVGWFNANNVTPPQGFLYSGGSYSILNAPGANWTDPEGINNNGRVVGESELGPFLYSNGVYSVFANGTNIEAFGINDADQIVGRLDEAFGINEDQIVGRLEISETPLPAALPLFATGLGALGLFGWRRKRTRAT